MKTVEVLIFTFFNGLIMNVDSRSDRNWRSVPSHLFDPSDPFEHFDPFSKFHSGASRWKYFNDLNLLADRNMLDA